MGKLELDLIWGLDINSAWSIIIFQLIKKIKKDQQLYAAFHWKIPSCELRK